MGRSNGAGVTYSSGMPFLYGSENPNRSLPYSLKTMSICSLDCQVSSIDMIPGWRKSLRILISRSILFAAPSVRHRDLRIILITQRRLSDWRTTDLTTLSDDRHFFTPSWAPTIPYAANLHEVALFPNRAGSEGMGAGSLTHVSNNRRVFSFWLGACVGL